MKFDPFLAYAHACGAAGVNKPDAERIGTLAARLWRHAVNGCNRPVTAREETGDRNARAELVSIGGCLSDGSRIEVDDSALPRVYIVTGSARIFVPVRNP